MISTFEAIILGMVLGGILLELVKFLSKRKKDANSSTEVNQ